MATPLPLSTAQHHVSLSNHERQELVDFVASHCSAPEDLTDQQVWALVQRYPVALPSIESSLDAISNNQITHLLIDNCPIEDLPAPPTNGLRPATKGWLSETILLQLALASRLEPFAFAEERNGALIQEVVPTRTGEISSLGGSVPLGWHSDKGFLKSPFRPEYLCLIGLLNDSTPTLLADVIEALDMLRGQDSSLVKILEYPLFRVASPTSLRGAGGVRLMSEPRPLVVNCNGFKTISGNLQTLVAEPEAQPALEAFEMALESVARPILIRPGSALLFSNTAALHGRAAIATRRWLQRCYMRRSLATLREASASPGGRIFSMAEIIGQ